MNETRAFAHSFFKTRSETEITGNQMRAIILAAGLGLRLQQPPEEQFPKCLLRFDGVSLLERHLQILDAAGVSEIVLALGFRPELVRDELERLGRDPEIVLNLDYSLGSVLTVHTVAEALTRGGDVLLMDADVLYDERMIRALVAGENVNRLLLDRGFEAGDEPVKLCVKDGVPVELRKQLAVGLHYDTIGESVGFFRFREDTARRFAEIVAGYIDSGRANMPHEEAVRDLLLEGGHVFDIADVTGAPWIEIDFPNDVARAGDEVLPRLQRSVGVTR
jgi:choline kinase